MLLPLDVVTMQVECLFFPCRRVEQLNGALINGLEARVSLINKRKRGRERPIFKKKL